MALVRIEMQLFESTHRMQWFLRQLWAMIGKIVERQRSVIVRIGPITLHYRLCFNTITVRHCVDLRIRRACSYCAWSSVLQVYVEHLKEANLWRTSRHSTCTYPHAYTNNYTYKFKNTYILHIYILSNHIEINVCVCVSACMSVCVCVCCAIHVWCCVQFTVISQKCSTKEYL